MKESYPKYIYHHHLEAFGRHFWFRCPTIIKIYTLSLQQQTKTMSQTHQRINQNGSEKNQPSTVLSRSHCHCLVDNNSKLPTVSKTQVTWAQPFSGGAFFVDCENKHGKEESEETTNREIQIPNFMFIRLMLEIYRKSNGPSWGW